VSNVVVVRPSENGPIGRRLRSPGRIAKTDWPHLFG
jgi:hypothetical protein